MFLQCWPSHVLKFPWNRNLWHEPIPSQFCCWRDENLSDHIYCRQRSWPVVSSNLPHVSLGLLYLSHVIICCSLLLCFLLLCWSYRETMRDLLKSCRWWYRRPTWTHLIVNSKQPIDLCILLVRLCLWVKGDMQVRRLSSSQSMSLLSLDHNCIYQ